ncbi:MAG: carboxypeptidase regulatory-like domain-containing protein [Planctomycetota bacterium]|jgi:hypothetical protein
MKRSNAPLMLALSFCLIGALALLYLREASQRKAEETADADHGIEASAGGSEDGGAPSTGDGATDRGRIEALIDRFGGFAARGRVLLTRPYGPGQNLVVRLRGLVAGAVVEARAQTAADGRFELDPLPRSGDYNVLVEGLRTQPFRRDRITPPKEEELDLGDLVVDRYYFVSGRVLGRGPGALAGAEIALIEPTGTGSFSFYKASAQAAQEDPAVAETKTGPDGRFRLRLDRPGIFTLRARAEGWAPHYRGEITVGGSLDVRLSVALTPGCEVVGYVLDAAARPVAGAPVVFYGAGIGAVTAPKEVTWTDGTGRFEFRVELTERDYVLSVVPERGLDMNTRFKVPLTEDLLLRLPGHGILSGRVVHGRTKRPVAEAEVLVGISRTPDAVRMPDYSKAIRTDADGAFRVEGVGKGFISTLAVRAPGFADLRLGAIMPTDAELWRKVQDIALTGRDNPKLPPLRLRRGKVLRGTMRDEATGRALAGATVELWDFLMGNRLARTAKDGTYRFEGVGDRVVMIVSKEGYATFRDQPMPGHVLGKESDTAVRDVSLEPGGTLEGVVRTADGEPVSRALVRLRPADRGWGAWRTALGLRNLWTHTDAGGNYRVTGVPAVRLQAEAVALGFDRGLSAEREVKPSGREQNLNIQVQPAARVEGVVATRDGDSLPSARVTIASEPADKSAAAARQALAEGVHGFTNHKGRFALVNVPVGNLLIRVEADGFATLIERQRNVKGGQVLTGVVFQMAPVLVISGKVVNASSLPLAHCWVCATQTASPVGAPLQQKVGTRVEADGTFHLRHLAVGTYTLEVRANNDLPGLPRYQALTLPDVAGGTKNLVLTLDAVPE